MSCEFCHSPIVTKGLCRLECGHQYHPSCVFHAYRSLGNCVVCQRAAYDGAPIMVDNGMDPEITDLQLKQVRQWHEERERNTPIGKLTSWFMNFTIQKSAKDVVESRAPFSSIQSSYTVADLVRSGVTVQLWFKNGYTPEQLFSFSPSFEDLLHMKIGVREIAQISLKTLLSKVSPVTILSMKLSLEEISQLRGTAQEYRQCGILYGDLAHKGLVVEKIYMFPLITPHGWMELNAPFPFIEKVKSIPSLLSQMGWTTQMIDNAKPKPKY